jgi:hypothetical protein
VTTLREIAETMEKRGLWPSTPFVRSSEIGRKAFHVIESWESNVAKLGDVTMTYQHGDANPRNIFIHGDRTFLIDPARIGLWPLGYDIARLALQLRMLLTGASEHADQFADEFVRWVKEPVGDVSIRKDAETSSCPSAVVCENSFQAWLDSSGITSKQDRTAFEVSTMWDLIKVVSYGDLSVFKRIWALCECERLIGKYFG